MKKIKKLIAVMLLSLTLFNSIFSSYSMTVQATEVATLTVIEAFLSLFGLELGLGNQSEFFSNSEFTNFVTAVSNGETVSIPSYGDVNFSDGESILSFMTWASALSYTAADGDVLTLAKMLDSTSYKNSGTSATNAMEQQISAAVGDYNGSETLAKDIQDTFSVVTGVSSDDVMTSSRWDMFTAIMSTFLLGASKTFNEFVDSLSVPEETEFQEYINVFSDDGYASNRVYCTYSNTDDPDYLSYANYYVVGRVHTAAQSTYSRVMSPILIPSYYFDSDKYFVFCALQDNSLNFYCKYITSSTIDGVPLNGAYYQPEDEKYYHPFWNNIGWNYSLVDCLCLPIFESVDAAIAYLEEGDTSGLLNAVDVIAYPDFRKTAPTASATISVPLSKWLDTGVKVDSVPDIVTKVLDVSRSVVGKIDYVDTVNTAIQEATGVKADTGTETETSTNYTGILGKILAAILALPAATFDLFLNPIDVILKTLRALATWQDGFLDWIKTAYADAMAKVDAIATTANPNGPIDQDDDGSGKGTLNILNGFLLLIGIFFILLRIFLHLLEFIINVFRIPASPGFITGDFAIGFEYIKSVQLSPLSISVYDFLMGLVHILVLFSVVKVLKKHIDKIHI